MLSKWFGGLGRPERRDATKRYARRRLLCCEILEIRLAMAIGELRIVDYNVLGYSGTPSTDFGTVLKAIGDEVYNGRSRPVDVVAIQEVKSQATTTASIVSQLNALYGAGRYASGTLNGTSTSANQTVGLIYNTQTVTLVSEVGVGTVSTSGAARQPIRYQIRPIGLPSGNDFYIYNSHYKATAQGTETQDLARRNAEAQMIRQNSDALGQGATILYVGDYNTKSSTEASFQTLIGAGNGQAFDPVNRLGDWSGTSSFKDIFTQAPAVNPPNGYVGGGLNDRFDFQLQSNEWTDGAGMEYVTGSYRTFANNGTVSLNGNINAASNTALSSLPNGATILNLLTTVTDHLPVVVDYEYKDPTPTLSVALSTSTVSEHGGTSTVTITRTGVTTNALAVSLSSSDPTAATLPSTVTIPAGASSATVTATGVDDLIADGSQTTTISAQSNGFASGSNVLTVTDDEIAALSISLNPTSISEAGGVSVATLRRNTPTQSSLTVNVSSSGTSAATVPATVTIPAGSASVDFNVSAVDDALADGSQSAMINVSSAGISSASTSLTVTDDDIARLILTLAASTIPENGGSTTATLRRNTPTLNSLTVDLSQSDPTAATTPASVTIPAGSDSVSFVVNAINDAIANGDQIDTITASALDMVSGSAQLTVVDDDAPTLQLTLSLDTILESGGSTIGTIRRNTPVESELLVAIASSLVGIVTMPTVVSIPAGATSATFTINAVDDVLALGNRTTSITASSNGFVNGSASLSITDDDTAQIGLSLSPSSISEKGGISTATVTRNTSTANAMTILVSNNKPTSVAMPTSVEIPAGESSVSFSIFAVDNQTAGGDVSVTVTASAASLTSSKTLTVQDDEAAKLTLSLQAGTIPESGGETTATLTRNTPTTDALTVMLSSDIANLLSLPSTIQIPAGADNVQFAITSVNDSLAYGDRTASVVASAAGLISSTASLTVLDDDAASLSLTLDPASISEKDGTTVATVHRNTPTTSDLVVTIQSSDLTAATAPQSVTIPSGASFATFTVTSVDDSALDGSQLTTIQVTASNFRPANMPLTVTDNEVASLHLSLSGASIKEGAGSLTATVSRNGPTDTPLNIELKSSDTTEADVPTTVTIPVGAAEITFEILAISDGIVDGDQLVNVTATAADFTSATAELTVLDADQWSWTNQVNPFDVDDDLTVSPLDVLVLVNDLNSNGQRTLPPLTGRPPAFLDVDRDKTVSPLDVLSVINYINSRAGSGEGERVEPTLLDSENTSCVDRVFADLDHALTEEHHRGNSRRK